MSQQLFKLHPFASQDGLTNFEIRGRIARQASVLELEYIVAGDRSDIVMPPVSDQPTRQHDLWQHTCFEFFVGLTGRDRYWEFNLSPAGHWNIYSFESYRQGMQEELAFASLPFTVQANSGTFSLSLKLDLQPFLAAYTTLADPENLLLGKSDSYSPQGWGARGAETDSAIALDNQSIDVAITTVVKHQNEQITYWALTHTGPEADFHRRDSFVIHL